MHGHRTCGSYNIYNIHYVAMQATCQRQIVILGRVLSVRNTSQQWNWNRKNNGIHYVAMQAICQCHIALVTTALYQVICRGAAKHSWYSLRGNASYLSMTYSAHNYPR